MEDQYTAVLICVCVCDCLCSIGGAPEAEDRGGQHASVCREKPPGPIPQHHRAGAAGCSETDRSAGGRLQDRHRHSNSPATGRLQDRHRHSPATGRLQDSDTALVQDGLVVYGSCGVVFLCCVVTGECVAVECVYSAVIVIYAIEV